MNLVRTQHDVVRNAYLSDVSDFLMVVSPAYGIVRITEKQDLGTPRDFAFEPFSVQRISIGFTAKGYGCELSPGKSWGCQEGGIYRGECQHFIAIVSKRPACKMQGGHQTRQPHDPRRLDLPLILFPHPGDDNLNKLVRRRCIAEYPVLHSLVQRFENGSGGLKVHVRHPHGDHVPVLVLVPLQAVRVSSITYLVEIEAHPTFIRIATFWTGVSS